MGKGMGREGGNVYPFTWRGRITQHCLAYDLAFLGDIYLHFFQGGYSSVCTSYITLQGFSEHRMLFSAFLLLCFV